MRPLALALALACNAPPVEGAVDAANVAATAQAAPPFDLQIEGLLPGVVSTYRAIGLAPGARVTFAASTAGTGSGPCDAQGLCADLLPPLVVLGTARANASGVAILLVRTPVSAATGSLVSFQAFKFAGAGEKSVVRTQLVGDRDNDLTVESEDNCPLIFNPIQEDADSDGWGDACDCFPNDPAAYPGVIDHPEDGIDQDCDGEVDDEARRFNGRYEGTWFSIERATAQPTVGEDCVGTIDLRLGSGPDLLRPITDGSATLVCSLVPIGGSLLPITVPLGGVYDPVARTIAGFATFPNGTFEWSGTLSDPAEGFSFEADILGIDIVGVDAEGTLAAERTGP